MRSERPPRAGQQGAGRRLSQLRLDTILPCFSRVLRQRDGSYLVSCPVPTHGRGRGDLNPSLHLWEEGNELRFYCFAGCDWQSVRRELERLAGIRPARQAQAEQEQPESQEPEQGLTLEQYASSKQLPLELLKQWGLYDTRWNERPAVAIPYFDEQGNLIATRYRLAMEGANRFRWERGNHPCLYGLWRLPEWDTDYLLLAEGESDTHCFWTAGLPALGIPGAGVWQPEWWEKVCRFARVYVTPDSDRAGEQLLRRLAESCPETLRERVRVIRLPEGCKDCSELWLQTEADPQRFLQALKACERVNLSVVSPTHDPDTTDTTDASDASDATGGGFRFTPRTYAEINPEPADVLVPNLLYAGRITFLAGESGVGKTTFSLELSDALEHGGLLWNRIPVPKTRILWLDFDHRFERLKEILEAYYGARNRDILCLPPEQLYPLSYETISAYRELIQREGIELVIADTAFDWLAVNDDCSDSEAREKMELVRQLAQETGVSILLLHHPNKHAESTHSTRALSGSHRWAAKADVVAYLVYDAQEGRDAVRLKIVKDRDGERREFRFERWQRRFIPLEAESLPTSDWRIISDYLAAHGTATYEELHQALQEAGLHLTINALKQRLRRWRRKGRVIIERTGFPAVSRVRLSQIHLAMPASCISCIASDGDIEAGDTTDEQEPDAASCISCIRCISCIAPGEGIGKGDTTGKPAPDDSAVPSRSESCDDPDFLNFVESATRPDDPFALEPHEVALLRELWQRARECNFPEVHLPVYNYTIRRGRENWLAAFYDLAGTPAVRDALAQLGGEQTVSDSVAGATAPAPTPAPDANGAGAFRCGCTARANSQLRRYTE